LRRFFVVFSLNEGAEIDEEKHVHLVLVVRFRFDRRQRQRPGVIVLANDKIAEIMCASHLMIIYFLNVVGKSVIRAVLSGFPHGY
jgi:hypothetical protein